MNDVPGSYLKGHNVQRTERAETHRQNLILLKALVVLNGKANLPMDPLGVGCQHVDCGAER